VAHDNKDKDSLKGNSFLLPVGVVSKVDVARLIRDISALDDFLVSSAVREPGTNVKLPKTSRLMDEVFEINKLNPTNKPDRSKLIELLKTVKNDAPQIHISFNLEPSPQFIQRLIKWLRDEMHPLMLLKLGLQPGIGAGAIVRTTNKYFDFSLRERFSASKEILLQKIRLVSIDTASKPKEVPENSIEETRQVNIAETTGV